jgi:hypothetical protein
MSFAPLLFTTNLNSGEFSREYIDRKSGTILQNSCLFHKIKHCVFKKIECYIDTDNQIQRYNIELKRMMGHSKSPNKKNERLNSSIFFK